MDKLFIGIGYTQAFYTLRQSYLWEGMEGGKIVREWRSYHHQNLSQDAGEAIEKAKGISVAIGVPFTAPTVADIEMEMRDIKRSNAEEMAQRQAASEAQQAYYEEMRAEREVIKRDMISMFDVVPFGPHADKHLANVPCDWLTWAASQGAEVDADSLLGLVAAKINAKYAHRILPSADLDKTVGDIGQRITIEATVVRTFSFAGFYGTTYLTSMVTDSSVCVIVKSGAFSSHVGHRLNLTGSVKSQDRYRDQMQTQLARVKVNSEIEPVLSADDGEAVRAAERRCYLYFNEPELLAAYDEFLVRKAERSLAKCA